MPSHSYDVLIRLAPEVPAAMVERAALWTRDSVPSTAAPAASVILLRDGQPVYHYGVADGMKSSECNGGYQPAGWKARDGRLWFPTQRVLPWLIRAGSTLWLRRSPSNL